MNKVTELVKLLPSKEEIVELRNHVSGNIARFKKDNQTFQSDFTHHLEIIRRYDEVLMQKASKHDTRELDKMFKEKMKEQCDELLNLINKNAVQIAKQKSTFDDLG